MVAAAPPSEPAGIPDKTVPAYTPPSKPANITHEPIARLEQVALSPMHPLGTVKEGGPVKLADGQTMTAQAGQQFSVTVPEGMVAEVTVTAVEQ